MLYSRNSMHIMGINLTIYFKKKSETTPSIESKTYYSISTEGLGNLVEKPGISTIGIDDTLQFMFESYDTYISKFEGESLDNLTWYDITEDIDLYASR